MYYTRVYFILYIYIYHYYITCYMLYSILYYITVPVGGLLRGPNYGQFSKSHVCFCGLDSGNLRFETVRTHKQRIYF